MKPACASVAPGAILGHFRVEEEVGRGGMGEVYRAWDLHLERAVAIKILPPDLELDGRRAAWFETEARALSALQHPGVVTVFELGSSKTAAGTPIRFLAMELIDGEVLSPALVARHGLARGLEWVAQIAEAVATAHDAGIVHRDLKPQNLMITSAGRAKVLDFGIAVLSERDGPRGETKTLVGTPGYASPEQIAGDGADSRSDVFALGCVLFELVTGRAPFARATRVDALHAVLHDPPPPLPPGLPPELQRIIRKCIAKPREERYQSMKDLALDLRATAAEITAPLPPRAASRRTNAITLAGLVVVLALALLISRPASETAEPEPGLSMERLTNSGDIGGAAISGDGRILAFSQQEATGKSLWIQQIATGSAVKLVTTHALFAFFIAPGDEWIYYLGSDAPAGVLDLTRIPLLGGQPEVLLRNVEAFALAPDGERLAYLRFHADRRDSSIYVKHRDAAEPKPLLTVRAPEHLGPPVFHPDGGSVGFVASSGASPERRRFDVIDLETGARRTLFEIPSDLIVNRTLWHPDGSGVIARAGVGRSDRHLWWFPLEGGAPRKITSDLSFYSLPTITRDGSSLAAVRTEKTSNLAILDLETHMVRPLTTGLGNPFGVPRWMSANEISFTDFDRDGDSLRTISTDGRRTSSLAWTESRAESPPGRNRINARTASFSRDGSKVAFVSDRSGSQAIWVANRDGTELRRLFEGPVLAPMFFPDGKSIGFSTFGKLQRVWRQSIDGGDPVRLTDAPSNLFAISPDGKLLLCQYRTTGGEAEPAGVVWKVAIVPADGEGETRLFDMAAGSAEPRWLPDQTAFSYAVRRGEVTNLWAQPIDGGPPRQLTSFESGLIFDHDWSPDGRFLVLAQGQFVSDAVVIRNFR